MNLSAHLVDDLDSLDRVDLAMQFEETFSIELQEESFKSVRTVQDVVDFIYEALVRTRYLDEAAGERVANRLNRGARGSDRAFAVSQKS